MGTEPERRSEHVELPMTDHEPTEGGACGVPGCTIAAHQHAPFQPLWRDDNLIEQIVARRHDTAFMDRLRQRIEEDGTILARLDDGHQCRFPQPNTAGFPVNQCLDCGGWIIAAPDLTPPPELPASGRSTG